MLRLPFVGAVLVVFIAGMGGLVYTALAAKSEQAGEQKTDVQQSLGELQSICVFSRADVFAHSIVGQQGNQRMQQLTQQARGTIAQDRKQLAADINAFSQQSDQLSDEERQQRLQALRQRQATFKQQTQRIDARIRHTRNVVTQRIGQQINGVLQTVAKQRGCSIVFKRDSVALGPQGWDVTSAAIQALNEKVDTINFDLLRLPTPPADDAAADQADQAAQAE